MDDISLHGLDEVLEQGRDRVLKDAAILAQADRVGMTPEDLRQVLAQPPEVLWGPCLRRVAELRRAEGKLQDYRRQASSHLLGLESVSAEDPAPPESVLDRGRSRRQQRNDEALERVIDETLERDRQWHALRTRVDEARHALADALVEQSLLPELRLAINERQRERARRDAERRDPFRAPLPARVQLAPLRQEFDPERIVATAARRELDELTDPRTSNRVSIGVAGSRGCGKSALLTAVVQTWTGGVRIFVPAPTSYVPREFLLYLYDRVCNAVLKPYQDPLSLVDDAPPLVRELPSSRLAANSLLTLVIVPALGTAAGLALLVSLAPRIMTGAPAELRGLGGALVALAGTALILYLVQRRAEPLSRASRAGSAAALLAGRDLLGWALPGARRLLGVLLGAGLLLLAVSTRWVTLTPQDTVGTLLVGSAVVTSVFWPVKRLGRQASIRGETQTVPSGTVPLLQELLDAGRRQTLLMAVAAGQVLTAAAGVALLVLSPVTAVLDLPLVLGALLTASSATGLAVGARWFGALRRGAVPEDVAAEASVDLAHLEYARRARDRIRSMRTVQSGHNAGVKLGANGWLPFGIESALTASTTEAEAPLTTPEIVQGIKYLLGARGPAVVAIDELDKIESVDKAREFLNEIKGVLEAPQTRFLVSMSEDAIARFERRGLPFRDVFDSAFDEVVRVSYLSYAEAEKLLKERVTDVPPPFLALAYCQAGGLPRDLLRAAYRILSTSSHESLGHRSSARSLERVARQLVHRDLSAKNEAVTAAIKPMSLEPAVSVVLAALHRLDNCQWTGDRTVPCLLDKDWLAPMTALGNVMEATADEPEADASERRSLLRLTVELVGYYYYCRTLLELFDVGEDEAVDRLMAAVEEAEGAALAELVQARQNFAVNPFLAWDQITQARTSLKLESFDLPRTLKVRQRPPEGGGTEPPVSARSGTSSREANGQRGLASSDRADDLSLSSHG